MDVLEIGGVNSVYYHKDKKVQPPTIIYNTFIGNKIC